MGATYVIGEDEGALLREQVATCSLRLLSIARTYHEEDSMARDCVTVTFEVSSEGAPSFTMTQFVPLPEYSTPIQSRLDQIMEVAVETLRQRLERMASLLGSPRKASP